MIVGIACNVKPEEIRDLGLDEEPPSTGVLPEDTYAEWDSAHTIRAVADALETRYQVKILVADSDFARKLDGAGVDFVFNIAEGLAGTFRESLVPALLEERNIPYTGSDPLTLALCLDKARAKEILAFYGVPTPDFEVIHDAVEADRLARFPLPAILKPLAEGSSKGIFDANVVRTSEAAVAKTRELLEKYHQPVLAERFLTGREFTVGVLGNPPRRRVLPIVEINFSELPPGANPIYSYEAKWMWDTPEKPLQMFTCPARLDPELRTRIEAVVLDALKVLRVRDWCRVDVRLDGTGAPQIIELNPLPGILPDPKENSCLPKAARAAGMTYEELILHVVEAARARYA
jgi:D-alanine-D-alanine ligase